MTIMDTLWDWALVVHSVGLKITLQVLLNVANFILDTYIIVIAPMLLQYNGFIDV